MAINETLEKKYTPIQTGPTVNLSMVRISDARARFLEGRDSVYDERLVPKKPNRYVHEDFPLMTEGNLERVSVRAGDIDLGYGVFGVYKEGERRIGELAMVRVAPSVKGLGIGSAIVSYGISRVLDKGVDALRMEIADKTGKIAKIARDLDFRLIGSTPGIKGNLIVERPVAENEALELQKKTGINAAAKLKHAQENPDLLDRIDRAERDNPLKDDPVSSIERRLSASNYKKAGESFNVVYWGYPGARLMVAMIRTPDNKQAIEASVRDIAPEDAKRALRDRLNGFVVNPTDFGLGREYTGSVIRGQGSDFNTAVKDLLPLTELSAELVYRLEAEKYVGG
jgi:GNAT superfamily N-acetyltransferase